MRRSIWFPALIDNPISDSRIYKELQQEYWQAHKRVLKDGISIIRLFIIDDEKDLNLKVDTHDGAESVMELIKKQDAENNLETGICRLADFDSPMAASISMGTEDFIIFDDEDNPRCYLLSEIGASSLGSIVYDTKEIYNRLAAIKWLLDNHNYLVGPQR